MFTKTKQTTLCSLHTARASSAVIALAQRLQERATARLLGSLGGGGVEDGADGLLEDRLETGLVERRALNILDGADGLAHVHALLEGDGGKALLSEAVDGLLIIAKIELGADQEEGGVGAVVLDLGVPLGLDVLERGGGDDREADKEDIGLGVGEGAEAVIVLLTGGIPETKVNRLAVDHDVGRVVVEDSGDVLAGEGVGLGKRVRDVSVATSGSLGRTVYEMRRHVLPTAPSPTTTHLMACIVAVEEGKRSWAARCLLGDLNGAPRPLL